MIEKKIFEQEQIEKRALEKVESNIESIENIKRYLFQLDYINECIPGLDRDNLVELITSLKGGQLSNSELKIISQIQNK